MSVFKARTIVRDLRPMPFFDLIIRWVESSDFGPKSDDLGHRILKSDISRGILQTRIAF